jgi:class 3 adenylate cyclase/CHASE2 domain-containing sensor protein
MLRQRLTAPCMTRSQRRRLINTAVLGVLLTLLVAALDAAGALFAPETFFYDYRARYCQFFTPPPTDKLVHLDIDDRSLEVIGRWPWPRERLAQIIDEVRLAGASALAMDIVLSEPTPLRLEQVAGPPAHGADGAVLARPFDADEELAAALRRFGRAIVPVSLNLSGQQPATAIYLALVSALIEDPELTPEAAVTLLQQRGRREDDLAELVGRDFANARREAMFERIAREARAGPVSFEELRRRILVKTPPHITGSVEIRVLGEQLQRFQAVQALQRFGRPLPQGLPPLLNAREEHAPLRRFSEAAQSSGFVDYLLMADGVVRSVPLWAAHRGYMYPQLGLSLACAMLDVPLDQVRLSHDAVVIPHKGGQVRIPVRTESTRLGRGGMFFHIPWFGSWGSSNMAWLTMYDYPEHRTSRQHLPLHYVWEACELRQRIIHNNAQADKAIAFLLSQEDRAGLERFKASPPDPADIGARQRIAEALLAKLERDGTVEFWRALDPAQMTEAERVLRDNMLDSPPALAELMRQNQGLAGDLARRRADLRSHLQGRAALMGFIAVGMIADVVPTSLHPRCPGVVVHGVVFNAIMTGDFWRMAPGWVTILITIAMGLLTTLLVAVFSAWRAVIAATLLGIGYLLFNGLVLFDWGNLLVGVAGPIIGSMTVWAGCTLAGYVLEVSERKRVERNLGQYVDKALARYVLEHDADLTGQVRELTVVFTDLEGFTTISEMLREKTVPLLNRYLALMVPIIRRHRGLVNKFLGDGVMFFYGAPEEIAVHTEPAINTVLEMHQAMGPFNETLAREGLPTLSLRAGITAGPMVVGNAGSPDRSDYTVLGDIVNLAARLEPANKVFGTRILTNDRARELVADRFLFRPVGRLKVLGKNEIVMVHEPICRLQEATAQQRRCAELTAAVVHAFVQRQFEACIKAADEMDAAIGPSKLTALYRRQCQAYLCQAPGEEFDGQIVLTEK